MEILILPFFFMWAAVAIAAWVLWIWMLVECLMYEPNDGNEKVIWVLVLIFTQWIGAVIYFFLRRPQRIRDLGQ